MRENKFRAWDEGNKVMHYDFQFFTSGEEGNDWICFSSDKEKRNTSAGCGIFFNNPYFRHQLKIMQYTGLWDKHGILIYEGDLVKLGSLNGINCYGKIVYKHCGFVIEIPMQDDKPIYSSIMCDPIYKNTAEVVGNIYSHPGICVN